MKSCGIPNSNILCDSDENLSLLPSDFATREINALLWIALITITSLLLNRVFKLVGLWAKAKKIPGPPCPSFYGHFNLISCGNFTNLLSDLHQKYGSVVKLWLGPTQLLVSMKDPVLIKEMLLKAEDKLPLSGRAFRLAFGRSSLFVSSFDKVQTRRESLAVELNKKLVERAKVIPTKVVNCVMERIHEIMAKGSVDCKIVSQHMAFTIMGATLFGDAFLGWSKATVYEEILMMIAKDACFWASYRIPPFWKQGFWRYQYLCSKLKGLTQDIVQQCRKNCKQFCHKNQNPHNNTTNIEVEASSGAPSGSGVLTWDNLFSEELNGHLNAREEPCGNIMGIMYHGCLTTKGLIGNVLARLVINPEIQEKIYSEIMVARKEEQQSVDKMLLLLATVYECARLLPAGSLLQRCSLKHDLNLKTGVMIPAGAALVVPVQLVQTDDSWGSDACKFNPYRFLSNTGPAEESVDSKQNSFILNDPNENAAFLPFGSGTRACVGQKFVIQGVATLFASLLEHFEIRPVPGSENDPEPRILFVTRN